MKQGLEAATSFSKVGPDLAGFPSSKRYLVLFLNNTELRPGGGFIGSFGLMSIENGEITSFPTKDIYELDSNFSGNIQPPEPVKKYLADQWFMRDSNWSPDFPTSAEKVLEFYRLESGDTEPIDGVIGLTPTIFEDLLGITGDIEVPGYPYTFTAENFTEQLEFAVEFDFANLGIAEANRKQIIGDLNEVILAKLLSLPQEQWTELATLLLQDINERQLMVYLTDTIADREVIEPVLSDNNWDGHIIQTEKDFVMLVDANFYALKSDPVVKRTLDYQVSWTNEDTAVAKTIIEYKHEGFKDEFTDAYQTYARILAPIGSTFIAIENADTEVDIIEEHGKASFGFLKRIGTADNGDC